MNELDFSIFNEFWNGHPNHLPLMGLHNDNDEPNEWNLNKSLKRLDFICDNNNEKLVIEGIHKLLSSDNWRPHLVGILASFKISPDEQKKLIPSLWTRLEKGSWISPQILSVLSIIDEDFYLRGKEILDKGFQVNYSPLDMIQHHSSRGPEGSQDALEKVINSIKVLLENQDDDFGWKGNLVRLIKDKRFKISTKYNIE